MTKLNKTIDTLVKTAQLLDKQGLYHLADNIEQVLVKIAQENAPIGASPAFMQSGIIAPWTAAGVNPNLGFTANLPGGINWYDTGITPTKFPKLGNNPSENAKILENYARSRWPQWMSLSEYTRQSGLAYLEKQAREAGMNYNQYMQKQQQQQQTQQPNDSFGGLFSK